MLAMESGQTVCQVPFKKTSLLTWWKQQCGLGKSVLWGTNFRLQWTCRKTNVHSQLEWHQEWKFSVLYASF